MANKFSRKKHDVLADTVKDNIDSVAEFYAREEEKISSSQNFIEVMSIFFSSTIYFSGFIVFVALWIIVGCVGQHLGYVLFDPPPFVWLQGIVALNGVLITITVLVRQSRMARLADLHAHLNLQVNLLAEQKASKIIQLLEELRKDSPGVKDRVDPEIESMQMQTDPHAVLNAIDAQKVLKPTP